MADTFKTCLAFTLQEEGGWSDDPRDPGGCTMHGITLPSFRDWKQNFHLSCADLHAISTNDIAAFYLKMYWTPASAQSLPLGVDLMVFDAAVNMGLSGSVKLLQQQLNVTVDGDMGPATLAAVLTFDPSALVASLYQAQTAFYQSLAEFAIYGTGWLRRVDARHTAALSLMSIS